MRLPKEPLTYEQLADGISKELPDGPVVVVAESFSGPIAVALAERHAVTALVLCNSFAVAPRWHVLRWFVLPILFRLPPPAFLIRRFMVGLQADDELVRDVAASVASVPARVLASRLQSVLTVDKTDAFASSKVPTLYLRATEDRLVPESACRRIAAMRPITIVRLPGPHLLLQANPKGAWDAIVRFLDSAPAV
jgi:pimeloyl-[acyl-carrier protein] methyl ester esterase